MKFNDEYDDYGGNRIKSTAIGVGIVMILAVILFVLIANSDNLSSQKTSVSGSVSYSSVFVDKSPETSLDETKLTPSDLDFYDLYPEEEEETPSDLSLSVSQETASVETDPSKDGNHTLLTYEDGTEEWVEISDYIKKNSYDYTNLQSQDGIMEYMEDQRVVSAFGVDISKDQDYVDFNKLKKAGCDFVMIRVGARGYTSGTLTIDDYFKDNIKRATDADLDVGVYFLSQAITEEEAEEEAELVLEEVKGYTLTYPVAFVMQYPENDTCRVESLSKNEKTMIARAFLKKIEEGGYKSVLYGTKVWLISYLELSRIASDFDVWLSEEADLPDYPYKFTMWQYNKSGTIDGIKGEVNFDIAFVDYTLR